MKQYKKNNLIDKQFKNYPALLLDKKNRVKYRTFKRKQVRYVQRRRLLCKRGVVDQWGVPNIGFENDPRYLQFLQITGDWCLAGYLNDPLYW